MKNRFAIVWALMGDLVMREWFQKMIFYIERQARAREFHGRADHSRCFPRRAMVSSSPQAERPLILRDAGTAGGAP
jgi:hypothetical protein